jgi:short-subunit dehydrogenase
LKLGSFSLTKEFVGMSKSLFWAGRSAIVCGGSSGLGLQLVDALARQKSRVVILGRDIARLESACAMALKNGAESAVYFAIDLGSPKHRDCDDFIQLQKWLSENQLDLLVNAIGRSDRGSLELVSSSELVAMFQDNVLCTWNMIQSSLDSLKRASGVIVNIGSLAGIIASPNMGGYSIVKSGLTALSRQLRLELEPHRVAVMLVCPGPIARHDANSRYTELARSRGLNQPSSSAPAGGAKLKLIDPDMLCSMILNAAAQRKKELIYPSKAKWLAAIAPIWPSLADRILKRYLRPTAP